jgi:predicted GTPase
MVESFNQINACVVGTTGVGKSSTCNTLANDPTKSTYKEMASLSGGTTKMK